VTTDFRHPARLGVDVVAALNFAASLLRFVGLSIAVPVIFALAHDETPWPFLGAGAIVSGGAFAVERLTRGRGQVGVREGYLVVSLVWLVAAGFGALPYVLAGDPQLGRPVDALFEGMSGFTTTGASVATDVAALPVSMQIWRQLTVWLGGIGVIALALAVLPKLRVGGRQLLESESAGPSIDSISERISETVRRFAALYLGISVVGFLALALPGWLGTARAMDTFDAFAHALTTIGTGGFSTEPRSIGAFAPVSQWTIIVFMAVAGTNFVLLHRALIQRRPRTAFRDEELRWYLAILVIASAVIAVAVMADGPEKGGEAIRAATFMVTSVITTTGYFTADYGEWPLFALMAIALLFFIGACAGSTAGAIKVVRHILLARILGREVARTIHPELVKPVRYNGVVVDQQALMAVIAFVLIYLAVFVIGTAVIAFDSSLAGRPEAGTLDLIFASASTLANSGFGLGAAGTTGSFATFGDPSTITMTVLMWLGRLEIIPVVVLLRRSYWRV
jgi:trk system potassium uptake protein TrkH